MSYRASNMTKYATIVSTKYETEFATDDKIVDIVAELWSEINDRFQYMIDIVREESK